MAEPGRARDAIAPDAAITGGPPEPAGRHAGGDQEDDEQEGPSSRWRPFAALVTLHACDSALVCRAVGLDGRAGTWLDRGSRDVQRAGHRHGGENDRGEKRAP